MVVFTSGLTPIQSKMGCHLQPDICLNGGKVFYFNGLSGTTIHFVNLGIPDFHMRNSSVLVPMS